MAETQVRTIEDATSQDSNVPPPGPDAIARRSISIFSRRGSDLPEPRASLFIAPEVMETPRLTKRMSERQKNWLGRKKGISGSNLKKSRGTVLHAVPAARVINMSALEEEMATSPNEEILSAVTDHPPAGLVFTNSPNKLMSPQQRTFWNNGPASPTGRSNSMKRQDQANRIGVWVSGVTHWDDKIETEVDSNADAVSGTVENKVPTIALPKRYLSGTLPTIKQSVSETAVATVVRSTASRAILCVTPPSLISKFSAISPTAAAEGPHSASPSSVDRSKSLTPPPSAGSLEVVESPASKKQKASRRSSSSCSSIVERDDVSVNSRRSSATSIADNCPSKSPGGVDNTSGEEGHHESPVCDPAVEAEVAGAQRNLDKPLPPIPMATPVRSEPSFSSSPKLPADVINGGLHIVASTRSAPGLRKVDAQRLMVEPTVVRRSVSVLDRYDEEFITSNPYGPEIAKSNSPTLSQAENELRNELLHVAPCEATQMESPPATGGSIERGDSVRSVMQPPERAPTVPRRSRKREWCRSPQGRKRQPEKLPSRCRSESHLREVSAGSAQDDEQQSGKESSFRGRTVRKSMSESQLSILKARSTSADAPEVVILVPQIVIDDGLIVVEGPTVAGESIVESEDLQARSAASAEDVLLHILQSLKSPQDLFNTAQINKGMYRVYKENAMHLTRAVAYNQSSAAWEFREWCPPQTGGMELSQLEYTPLTYMKSHYRDLEVIESLKKQILGHCQSFIRRETAFAISTPAHPKAQRFTDAFWRIWAFCEIFGGKKGRIEDVTGQLDWLRGGLLAENQGCVATVNTNLDYELSSVLLNAPDFFAKGNPEGLSAKQLYDMTEIWTCLTALLSGYNGRIDQARDNGVFNGCDVEAGDVEKEGQLLEEWLNHVLTLGPVVIVQLAQHANDSNSTGFTIARRNGWTTWSPPQYNASRSTFLKEPVSRLYEERVIAAAIQSQSPLEQEKKEMSRKRVASLAAEIRLARQASSFKRLPLIDMNSERAMSMVDRGVSAVSVTTQDSIPNVADRSSGIVSPLLSPNLSIPSPMMQSLSPPTTQPSTPVTPSTTTSTRPPFVPPLPPRRHHRRAPRIQMNHHQRKISPIIEGRVETFNRMSLQQYGNGIAEDTSGLAVRKIVEMGFTPAQASEALRVTDMGDGLRVDRAVDLLIRQRC